MFRKFADIGHTVSLQYGNGIYHIVDWADLVTVHSLPGEGILQGLKSKLSKAERGCFLVAQLSSQGNLIRRDYTSGMYVSNIFKFTIDFLFFGTLVISV